MTITEEKVGLFLSFGFSFISCFPFEARRTLKSARAKEVIKYNYNQIQRMNHFHPLL
jgi:hypothetical protein